MKKTTGIVSLAAAAVLCFAAPAMAYTFTSSDGILSIELPNDNWKQVTDPDKWIALSDGGNLITIDHYSNGEKLPEATVADSHYVNVCQLTFSTQNEVFVLTGSVMNADVISEISQALVSAKVLKFDTKQAIKKDEKTSTASSEYTVVPMDKTMYVTSNGLNVRSGYSTSDSAIGGYSYGSAVKVTGSVQRGGADIGWYQVSFNGSTGYVSAEFLSDKEPAKKADSTKPGTTDRTSVTFTGEAKTIYEIDGHAVTVYLATDNNWYDNDGYRYTRTSDYEFTADNGAVLTTNKPQAYTDNVPVDSTFTAYWENGNTTTLTQYSDGYFYSADWVRYSYGGSGNYMGADGTVLYDFDPLADAGTDNTADTSDTSDNSGAGAEHVIANTVTGAYTTIYEMNGSLIDNYGNYYYYADDGSLYDDAENTYTMAY